MKPLNPIDRKRLKYMLEGKSPTGEEMSTTLEHQVPEYLADFVDEEESDFSNSTTQVTQNVHLATGSTSPSAG